MNKKQKLISDLVNTSRAYSGVSSMVPSLKDAAVIYVKIEDSSGKLENGYKKEFDGLDVSEMEDKRFDKRVENLVKKEKELEQALDNNLPVVEGKDDSIKKLSLDRLFETYTLPAGEDYSEALNTFIHSLKRYFGYSTDQELPIIDFPETSAKALHGSLIELGKISLKLRVMKEVEEEIDLNGSYNYYLRFESVPAACEYYTNELGDSVTRELLKNKIQEYARIYDEDSLIKEWGIINKRINSWVSHEGEKYNKKPIPTK